MFLNVAINLAQQARVSHAAYKVSVRDAALNIHLGEQVVTTDLSETTLHLSLWGLGMYKLSTPTYNNSLLTAEQWLTVAMPPALVAVNEASPSIKAYIYFKKKSYTHKSVILIWDIDTDMIFWSHLFLLFKTSLSIQNCLSAIECRRKSQLSC